MNILKKIKFAGAWNRSEIFRFPTSKYIRLRPHDYLANRKLAVLTQLINLQGLLKKMMASYRQPILKEYMSDSFTNYNYVGNTKVSVSIKKLMPTNAH